MIIMIVGLLIVMLWVGGSPADLFREIRQARDPVDLMIGIGVISFIIGAYVMAAAGYRP